MSGRLAPGEDRNGERDAGIGGLRWTGRKSRLTVF